MKRLLSIITPAYREENNLPILYQRLCGVLDQLDLDWEWIVVDDHSADATFEVIRQIAARDPRVRGLRLARNSGSHIAVTCGLEHCTGDCAAIMAADLQDPPETLPQLLASWQEGAQVIWAVRGSRPGEKASTRGLARIFYLIMRRIVGVEMPATGADFFLLDRVVIDAFLRFKEKNLSILALITWMGFRQTIITYEKQPRLHGRSGWTFNKKVKLAVDSVISFSSLPIRWISILGALVALLGFLYAIFIVIHALTGHPPLGWPSLIVVVLILGGIQMLMMGVLGEYIWRTLDEARRRPNYLIEDIINEPPAQEAHEG